MSTVDNRICSANTSHNVVLKQTFTVSFNYTVHFTEHVFDPGNDLFVKLLQSAGKNFRHRVLVVIDNGVASAVPTLTNDIIVYSHRCNTHIELACEPVVVAGGESLKSNSEELARLQQIVADLRLDRHSFIVGIGGGALLDTVGFVAATAHRGIRHIRVPTTVLAQNDSGVGVKNGVNQFGQKNYLGTFAPPFAVVNDYAFIKALPAREKVSGISEAVKVALIRDAVFFHWLESNANRLTEFNPQSLQYMIKRCAELHMTQIAKGGDPFETGSVRPLDFGHWAAHRLESLSAYTLRHGEAVAIGIALDTRYSVLAGLLAAGVDERIYRLLQHLGFALWHPAMATVNDKNHADILQGLSDFREHIGGELNITLIKEIGVAVEVQQIDQNLMLKAIEWLSNYRGGTFGDSRAIHNVGINKMAT
ncbi:MAG: 3-dehydroquinate synthase [Granulosicoccus sp.]